MKKVALYSLGGLILVGLAGFWVYSFLYGSPTNNAPVFANFDFFGGEAPAAEPLPVFVPTEPVVDVTTESLRQLTTKPVVGMRVIEIDSTPTMRYVEAGTGHIFDINLETGVEERVSNISVPQATVAKINSTGDMALIQANTDQAGELILVDLSDDEPTKKVVPATVESFAFGPRNEIFISSIKNGQTVAEQLNTSTNTFNTLFTVPFTEATIVWQEFASSSHYVATKNTSVLPGYIYKVAGNRLERLPIQGPNLSAVATAEGIYVRAGTDDAETGIYFSNESAVEMSATPLPEKCASTRDNILYCGGQIIESDEIDVDSWYRREVNFNDNILRISPGRFTSQIAIPNRLIGRNIDIETIHVIDKMLYFTNRYDQSLWLYEVN